MENDNKEIKIISIQDEADDLPQKYDEEEPLSGALGGDFVDSIEGESFVFGTVPDREIKNLEKDIQKLKQKKALEAEHGFHYEAKCKCCNIAVDDVNIHKIWLKSGQKTGSVQTYIVEKYGKKIKYDSIKRHMMEHFLPVYDEISYKRKENLLSIRRWIKEREDEIYPNKLQTFEEMIMQKMENVFIRSQNQSLEAELITLKTMASAGSVLLKIQEHKLQMLGSNKTPEEMQRLMTEYVKGLLSKILEKAPDEKTRKEWAVQFQKELSNGS